MTRHVTWDRGISLVGHDLWLDPLTVRDLAFVSHAHTDHTRRHRSAMLTADTLALLTAERRPRSSRTLRLGESVELGAARLTLHDAGHMLGSAQALFAHDGCRLLYPGDLKLRRGAGRADTVIPHAHADHSGDPQTPAARPRGRRAVSGQRRHRAGVSCGQRR